MKDIRWRALSRRTRRLIIGVAAVETVLKVAALLDMKRRPPAQIRGSKRRWALAVGFVNSAGAIPVAYFLYGRRPA